MPTIPPSNTPAPADLPLRGDRSTFSPRVDAFVTWFSTVWDEVAALATNCYNNAVEAYNYAVAALASANAASASAATAAATASAAMWISGHAYAQGECAVSPVDFATYRRKTAGSGVVDPSADRDNWADVISGARFLQLTQPSVTASGNSLTISVPSGETLFKNPTLNGALMRASWNDLSLVIPSAASLGISATGQYRIAFGIVYNGGTPQVFAQNLAGGFNFDESGVISTTAISAASTSATTPYSTSAVASSSYEMQGYVDVTYTVGTGWNTTPAMVRGKSIALLQSLADSRSWQSVTRNAGTTYYNTSGKTRKLQIWGYSTINDGGVQVVVTPFSGSQAHAINARGWGTGNTFYTPEITLDINCSYTITHTNFVQQGAIETF